MQVLESHSALSLNQRRKEALFDSELAFAAEVMGSRSMLSLGAFETVRRLLWGND